MQEGGIQLSLYVKDSCIIFEPDPFPVRNGSELTKGQENTVYKRYDKSNCKCDQGRKDKYRKIFFDRFFHNSFPFYIFKKKGGE